jgi:hypothetical protein
LSIVFENPFVRREAAHPHSHRQVLARTLDHYRNVRLTAGTLVDHSSATNGGFVNATTALPLTFSMTVPSGDFQRSPQK